MNTERYILPVVIAASLHGALFLISSEPTVVSSPPKKITEVWQKPPVDPITIEPDEVDADTGGPVSDCPLSPPSMPDPPAQLRDNESFTVPVEPYKPSLDPVKTLEGITGLPVGPGDPAGIVRPSLPDVGRLDRVPRAMVQTSPVYPDGARREGRDGTVTVEFIVGLDGQVVRAEAVSWTHRDFVEPAVSAVLRWRFEPGTVNGRKVSFRMAVPIEFNAAF